MKNAFVLVDHHGDSGTVREGMILRDVSNQRFDALEKHGLVREATAQEAKDGYRPDFESEAAAEDRAAKAAKAPSNKNAPAAKNKEA
ncbi:hypothetical protein [Sphingomonas sp.]|uniref:hypothetical protein n=1 Tax=Sphingomonas sp. TaxID=28214 RepID=UPI00257C58CE|nr:hypothetical protein [Sphingomonas sp.]